MTGVMEIGGSGRYSSAIGELAQAHSGAAVFKQPAISGGRNFVSDRLWDVIIVGQGLAGTTLAWCLKDAGQKVLVIDADEPVTSSKIAAGLITPITGQRLHKSRQYDDCMPSARTFYTAIEQRTGRSFFHERTAIRLFKGERERLKWAERRGAPDYVAHLAYPQPEPLIDTELFSADAGGFAMHAAQLDVPAFLDASRSALACETMEIDWEGNIGFDRETARVGHHEARFIVSCEGYRAAQNPFFTNVRFKAAKGDILTVQFQRPLPQINLHRDIWLAPTDKTDIFKAGASYDRDNLSSEPDPSARRWIEERIRAFVRVPFSVLDHVAAVRPVLEADRVLVGLHPDWNRLGFFNGLGSKGALQAPWYADRLARFIVNGEPLPGEMDAGGHIGP